jgi:hypothetical protein
VIGAKPIEYLSKIFNKTQGNSLMNLAAGLRGDESVRKLRCFFFETEKFLFRMQGLDFRAHSF